MKEKFNKIWNYLNGKKTIIGIVMHTLWLSWNLVDPTFASTTEQNIGHAIIFNITGVGIGHKVDKFLKSDTGKKIISWIGKLIKKK